jgi:Ca2+-binding EF-hand superfamily protein
MRVFLLALLVLGVNLCLGQEYGGEYRGRRRARGGNGLLPVIFGGMVGTVAGAWIQGGRIKKKYEKEKKDLVQYIQLQEEVYKTREQQWQSEYQKLYKAYDELEKETLERDYEEFKAPDTNNDDMISRAEFNTYVRKYLSSFPELSERDFPRFEEFDLDGDGIVSFEEWQQFLYQQKLLEAQKGQAGKKDSQTDLLNALYQQATQADSFNSLQQQMGKNRRGA